MFPEAQIKKFAQINERIRAEEIKAREYLIKISSVLDAQVREGLLDDYETETRFSVYSYNEAFCKSRQIEVGSPFYETDMYSLSPADDDFFNVNWYISGIKSIEKLKDFHFGYLMHCLINHTNLQIDDILAIDDVWIEVVVRHQFFYC